MIPPWLQFSDYPRFCIGWRMGAGEDYMENWREFLKNLSPDEKEQYKNDNPAPEEWESIYD